MDCLKISLITFTYFFIIIFSANASANGTIEGTVTFDGQAPQAKVVHMDADPVCYAINKGNTKSRSILVGEHNALSDVFIYVKSGLAKASYLPPSQEAVINQGGCNYSPHVVAVMAGQKVKFLNPDGTLHNVHAMCHVNPEFNASMPDFRKEMEVEFDKPEMMFPIRCDVHPWMQAWMAVMSHPFFAVTGPDGKFEIKNIPAGTYEIGAWHEKLEDKTAAVTVKDSSAQKLDFTFSVPK